jgi:putative DNA primase/helicase
MGDRSNGIWRRMLFLPFRIAIPKNEQEPQLAHKLKGEIAGILNWALAGRKNLYAREGFIMPRVSEESLEEYRQESNPAAVFLRDECRKEGSARTPVEGLYDCYREWAKRNAHSILGSAQLGREVKRVFGKAVQKVRPKMSDGTRIWMYQGLALVSSDVVEEVAA